VGLLILVYMTILFQLHRFMVLNEIRRHQSWTSNKFEWANC